MNRCSYLLAFLLLGLLSVESTAQYNLSANQLRAIPSLPLPLQNNEELLAKELASRKPGRPISFAVALATAARPATQGQWSLAGNTSVWRLRIHSPGAKSLNLGFSAYHLPVGASLFLISPEEKLGPFTQADNEEHNQLWTPIIAGDELIVELRVPTALKKRVQLFLTSVNHDFEGITKSLSGACNLDVVCGQADNWGIVDGYRGIIRSVAAYSVNGTDACTGFLVNNVNQDGQPFFMTADHCGVRSNNAPSIVAYWNFESDVCRQPGSEESGQTGFGSRNVFNSGATLLSSWVGSDFTLTLLDDPVNPNANAFFAGWDANPELPSDTTVTIHHPGVDEKRISFSFNQTYRVGRSGQNPVADGGYIEVPSWSIGTTEGGSSGSPLFDVDGYVRGQLFGGRAACGNALNDVYGYFPVSWEGDGAPETRLKDWLDPCGTGALKLDGMEYSAIAFSLTANGNCRTVCAGVPARIQLTAGSGFPAGTSVRILEAFPELSARISTDNVAGGERFDLIVESPADLMEGTYAVVVRAEAPGGTDDIELLVNVEEGLPVAPAVISPANNETGVTPFVTLSWESVGQAMTYDLQVSSFADFSFVSYAGTDLLENELSLPTLLESSTTYYWRVRSNNTCGVGTWATYAFTTNDLICNVAFSPDTPVEIAPSGTPVAVARVNSSVDNVIEAMEVTVVIDHTFIGDLDGTLTSPEGTTIQLFDPVLNGNCAGANMVVTFTDDAAQSHTDFSGNCNAGDEVAVAGLFQPAQPLSTFNGENPAGTWILTIQDGADFDGGQIVGLRIDFCGRGAATDLAVQSGVADLVACNNSAATFDLLLGEDYVSGLSLNASIDDTSLSDVTTSFNETTDLLTVTINNWSGVSLGTSELILEVVNPDGATRTVAFPVSLSRPSTVVAELFNPADNASFPEVDVVFDWSPVPGAASYRLEYSLDADFAELLGSAELTNTNLLVRDLPGGKIFWRVLALNPCGEAVSAVNAFTVTTNSTQDFGAGRELSVYPNPVQGLLTVEAIGNWPGTIRAGLFDAAGRFVAEYQINGTGRTEWNLGGLAAGVYYLRFSGAGQQRTERIVVLP